MANITRVLNNSGDKEVDRYSQAIVEFLKRNGIENAAFVWDMDYHCSDDELPGLVKDNLVIVSYDISLNSKGSEPHAYDYKLTDVEGNEKIMPAEVGDIAAKAKITLFAISKGKTENDALIGRLKAFWTSGKAILVNDPCFPEMSTKLELTDLNTGESDNRGEIVLTRLTMENSDCVYHCFNTDAKPDDNYCLKMMYLRQLNYIYSACGKSLGISGMVGPLYDSKKFSLTGVMPDYRKMRDAIHDGTITEELFYKIFKRYRLLCPDLYEKVTRGWGTENITNDLTARDEMFKARKIFLCNQLSIPEAYNDGNYNFNILGYQTIERITHELTINPYASIENVVNEIIEDEKIDIDRRRRESEEAAAQRREEKKAFNSQVAATAAGTAIGNKISGGKASSGTSRSKSTISYYGTGKC